MSRSARLSLVLLFNLVLVVGLLIVGIAAHSLGVLAEGADYAADGAAISVSLLAIRLSHRPPTEGRPHAYPRATTVAAAVNAGWLLILSLLVMGGAIDRLIVGGRPVRGLPVLDISSIAAVVMLGGALILGGDMGDDDDLNMRAVLLDTAADAAAAAGVAVTGGVIVAVRGLYWLDPSVALIIAVVVAVHAAQLLLKVTRALAH